MFRFSNHTFDPDTGELDGARESARLLAMLLEASGGLVEREQIRIALWPDTNVDFDAGLNTCMRQIRTALRESGGEVEYIETLPKRSYRITAPIRSAHGPRSRHADDSAAGCDRSNDRSDHRSEGALGTHIRSAHPPGLVRHRVASAAFGEPAVRNS